MQNNAFTLLNILLLVAMDEKIQIRVYCKLTSNYQYNNTQ